MVAAAGTMLLASCVKDDESLPQGVYINKKTVSLGKGETVTLTAKGVDLKEGANISWRSVNPSIASVDNGVVTAIAGGQAKIVAGWHQFRDTCIVNVVVPLEALVITPEERELKLGKSFQFKVAPVPADCTEPLDYVWTSSDESVATVDQNGLAEGLKEGDCDITVAIGDVKATAALKVRETISAIIQTAANIRGCYFEFAANWCGSSSFTNFTFECLFRGDAWKNSNSNVTSLFGVEGTWLLRLGDLGLEDNQLQLARSSSITTQQTFDAGTWYHLAVVQDQSANQIRFYVNGELAETGAYAAINIRGSSYGQKCRIGASYLDGSVNNRFFDGAVSEMRVWNVARTAEQINEYMYEYDVATLGNTGLVAYWKFNEGEGNTITDHSGNNRNATATGTVAWEDVALP